MPNRFLKKLLGGVVFLLVLAGLSRAFIFVTAKMDDSKANELLEQACGHLRELSAKPLPTCETELTAEKKALGGYYTRKLRCLGALSDLEGYKACSKIDHLNSFPE